MLIVVLRVFLTRIDETNIIAPSKMHCVLHASIKAAKKFAHGIQIALKEEVSFPPQLAFFLHFLKWHLTLDPLLTIHKAVCKSIRPLI